MSKKIKKWFVDNYSPNQPNYYRIKKVILRKKTPYQEIQILDLFRFGKSLVIDGIIQSAEKDEWIYHECLIHPALISQPINKKLKVLVLGAGEGATLRELLKYKNVKKITAVDIDKEAVEIFKKFFPEMHQNSFNNSRVNLVINSAENFLIRTVEKYDLIFSDITDANYINLGPRDKLSSENFYQIIARRLKKNGLFVMHAFELTETSYEKHLALRKMLIKIFPKIYSFRVYVPFFQTLWGFLIASKSKKFNPLNISQDTLQKRIKIHNLEKKLKYFSPEIYRAIFTLPPLIKKILD